MATLVNNSVALDSTRDNDYFTSTIVGLPSEVVLGKAFTARQLSNEPTITIQAMTAATWLSEPAQLMLKQHVKQSPKSLGLPYAAGSFASAGKEKFGIKAFLLGFCLCGALCYAYATLPWVQQLLRF
jgi:hypothetical protein